MKINNNIEQMSKQQRKELLYKIRIPHRLMVEGESKIREIWERTSRTTEPKHLLITGDAGTGKTTLLNSFVKKNNEEKLIENEREKVLTRNILHLKLPYPATIVATISRILIALGDDFPDAGKDIEQKTRRLVKFINKCKVSLIMIDEFQNMVDKDKKKTLMGAAEWIKDLMNYTKLPFVFFGTPKSVDILSANDGQLGRRIEFFHEMLRYPYSTTEDQVEFSLLLDKIDHVLPFLHSSLLQTPEMSIRIFHATDGLLHSMMTLITHAAELAIDDGSKHIELHHLDKAYIKNGYLSRKKLINPFRPDYLDQFYLNEKV